MKQDIAQAIIVIALSAAFALTITLTFNSIAALTTITALAVAIRAAFLTVTTLTLLKFLLKLCHFTPKSTYVPFIVCILPLASTKVAHSVLALPTDHFLSTLSNVDFLFAFRALPESKTVVDEFGLNGELARSLMFGLETTHTSNILFL